MRIYADMASTEIIEYMRWHVVHARARSLSDEVRVIQLDFNKVILGVQAQPERFKTCVATVKSVMPFVVGKLFRY